MQRILRSRRLAALSVLIALAAGGRIARRAAAAAPGSEAAALRSRVEWIHTEKSISLGLRDADLILRRYPDLKALVTLQDGAGRSIDTYLIDFAHEATPSHVVFSKVRGRDYRAYVLRLTHRDGVLLDVSGRLPKPVAIQTTGRLKLLDETADLERGTAFDAAAPQIRLPDFSQTPTYKVPKAPRETSVAACRRRVVSDFNFPIAGQTAFVSHSTPAARDLGDYSLYIPVNNDLYDPATGLYQSTFKYMVEIPIDPAWIADAKDTVTRVPPDRIRLYMTTEEIEVRRLGKQRITGNRKGLLGQTNHSTAIDDEGNLYFAMAYRSPIRFNVKKGRWEAPPVNVYDFHLPFKPKVEDLPYEKGSIEGVRTDFNNVIFYHRGRIYVAPTRYAIFGSLMLASVISIPVDHWDDKAAFQKAMRLNAASFPGAKFALWDTHVTKEDRRRKLNLMLAMGNRICLLAYHRNYFWIMEVADDGSTTKLVPVKTLNGKPIEEFTYEMDWLVRGENVLGLQMKVRLKGEKKMRTAFLPTAGYTLTEKLPEKAVERPFYYNKRTYLYNSTRSYGQLTCSKYNITKRMGKPHIGGNLTLYYDVWPRLRAVAEPYRDIVARTTAASMGPEYYLVSLPDRSMEVLGNADYPQYNFARYDCSSKAPAVKRTFLEKDLGDLDVRLGLSALLGPYCHHWFRDDGDDVLYYAGYTGVARLRYRVQGRRPPRFRIEKLFHGQDRHLSVDGAPDAYIKWYRDLLPGLGDKVFLTGVNKASRGGTAYSGGLMYFHRRRPNRLYKLSAMSRAYKTNFLAGRLVGAPGGRLEEDVLIRGGYSAADAQTLPEDKRPKNTQPRIFVYRDAGADGVHDLFGFTLAPEKARDVGTQDISVSPSGLYLLLLFDDNTLATFALDAWRFVDAIRFPASAAGLGVSQRSQRLLALPDGGRAVCVFEPAGDGRPTAATFVRIAVGPDGRIALAPHLRVAFEEPLAFVGPATFLYDSEKNDGSYDLVIGPHFRRPEGALKILRDFIPARPKAAAAFRL